MGHVSYIYNYHNTYDNLFFNIYSHDNFYEVVFICTLQKEYLVQLSVRGGWQAGPAGRAQKNTSTNRRLERYLARE